MNDRELFATLSSVASEIQDLARIADKLQTLISHTIVPGLGGDEAHVRELQAIDFLVQRLQGVATFVDALAGLTPTDWHVNAQAAAAGVQLSDLARRLAGGPDAAAEEGRDNSASGEFELFG